MVSAAELPKAKGQELDSRETATAPDLDPPEEAENEVDLLTREFWPWIKGKWDDINNAPGRRTSSAKH